MEEPKEFKPEVQLLDSKIYLGGNAGLKVKVMIVASLFVFLLGVASFTVPLLSHLYWPSEAMLILIIIGALLIFIGLGGLCWGNSALSQIVGRADFLQKSTQGAGAILFFVSLIVMALFYIALVYSWLWYDYTVSYEAAQTTKHGAFDKSLLNTFYYSLVGLFLGSLLGVGYIAYVAYRTSIRADGIFTGADISALLLGIFGIMTAIFGYICLRYTPLQRIKNLQAQSYIYGCICSGIGAIMVALIYFMITLKKLRRPYLVLGFSVFMLLILIVCFSGLTYRNTKLMRRSIQDGCLDALRLTRAEDVVNMGCPNKYLTETITVAEKQTEALDLDCPKEDQVYQWEADEKSPLAQKKYKLACLNKKCCPLLSSYNLRWYYRLVASTIGVLIFGILLAGLCLYLSHRIDIRKRYPVGMDIIIGILFLLLVLAALLVFFLYRWSSPKVLESEMLNKDLKFQDAVKMKSFPSDEARLQQSKGCRAIDDYSLTPQVFRINEAQCSNPGCVGEVLQVVILAKSGSFLLSGKFNDEAVRVLSDSDARGFLQPGVNETTAVIGFEGPATSLNSLLRSGLLVYCLKDPNVSIDYYYNQVSRNIKTSKRNGVSKNSNGGPSLNNFFSIKAKTNFVISSNLDSYLGNLKVLDNTVWGSLAIKVLDCRENTAINEAQYEVFEGFHDCLVLSEKSSLRQGSTNSSGQAILYNLYGGDYTLAFKKQGFHSECEKIKITPQSPWRQLNISLAAMEQGKNSLTVAASWEKHPGLVALTAVISPDNKMEECAVNYLNEECGEMFNKYSEHKAREIGAKPSAFRSLQSFTDSITVRRLSANKYLFFVSPVGEVALGNNLTTADRVLYRNKFFDETKVKVKVYVPESEYPIMESSPSKSLTGLESAYGHLDTSNDSKSPSVWLAFCVNGSYGTSSTKNLDRFWTDDGQMSFWSRNPESQRVFPSIEVCEAFYSAFPLV